MNSRMPGVNGYGGGGGYGGQNYGRPQKEDPYRNEPRYGRDPVESPYGRPDPYKGRGMEDPYRGPGDPYGGRQESPYSRDDAYSPRSGLPDDQRSLEDGYEVDHLATFTVGSQQGLLNPSDGVAKLRHMESSTGIWTMRVQLVVDSKDIIIYDKATGDEMEKFALNLVSDPTAVVNKRSQDRAYNNIVLFTVMEDMYRRNPTEMHLFQSVSSAAEDIVDELREAKEGRLDNRHSRPPPRGHVGDHIKNYEDQAQQNMVATDVYRGNMKRNEFPRTSTYAPHGDSETVMSERTDRDVQMLNHCFDDIEKFVGRLQHAAEAFKELDRRRKGHDKQKRGHGEGMLTMRARPPPAKDFIDIFQKFKLSFNLLAKLKPHIHDPNAPELVHFLFTPLSLVVEASKDPRNGAPDLAAKVISPLLTPEAKDLLLNCLTSKEVDLWTSLGDAWTLNSDQWKGYVPPYFPRFSDGWKPAYNQPEERAPEASHPTTQRPYDYRRGDVPESDHRYDPDHHRPDSDPRRYDPDPHRMYGNEPQRYPEQQRYNDPGYGGGRDMPAHQQQREPEPAYRPPSPRDPWEAEQQSFLQQLKNRGSRISEVVHERTGRNVKELTVRKGEFLEVVDDSRNWWKVRNSHQQEGHVPFTILQDNKGEGVRGK